MKREETSYSPEYSVLFKELYQINKDAHNVINTKLRPINSCPKTYWVKGKFEVVNHPIICSTMFPQHLMGGHINKAKIFQVACPYSLCENK